MAETFATFAAVAGVAGLTLQAIKSLGDDVQAIKDAPATVEKLRQDLSALASLLQTLEANTEESLQHLSTDANAVLAAALNSCKSACEIFQTKLKRWMRHSTDNHMHWWDRVRVGILADKNVETLSKQLLQCKVTINTAIGMMTLFVYLDS
jgi:Fungal N-terminal domain of STAND proteins